MPHLSEAGPVRILHLGDGANGFNPTFLSRLVELIDEVCSGDTGVALVTVGGAKFYSAGLDLKWSAECPDQVDAFISSVDLLLARVLTLPVPTVAAVTGHAFGAGALFALAHDFRLMSADHGAFCLPEVDIGATFSLGAVRLVQTKVSPAAAMALMTTGARLSGQEANALGVVDELVSHDEVVAGAVDRGTTLAGKDPDTLGAIKSSMFADVADRLHRAAPEST